MHSLSELLQQGSAYGWLFIPTAIALGALHGLEPGHSKTMMAAFIVAVHGTVKQAVLLGLAATVSHTAVVWVVALVGLYFGQKNGAAVNEPYFQLASGIIIIVIAGWMLLRLYRARHHGHHDHHDHEDAHALAHSREIEERFNGKQQVTNAQIIAFGLTGGLIPCPAAITVLLLCLQLKHIALGVTLVLCFSIGLAITLVASGVVASIGIRTAVRRFHWMPALMHKAPYLAGCIMLLVGGYVALLSLFSIVGH